MKMASSNSDEFKIEYKAEHIEESNLLSLIEPSYYFYSNDFKTKYEEQNNVINLEDKVNIKIEYDDEDSFFVDSLKSRTEEYEDINIPKIEENELQIKAEFVGTCETNILKNNPIKKRSRNVQKKKFKCNICGRVFSKSHHFKNHLKIHSNQKEYICDLNLVSNGHKENKFRCNQCHKLFTSFILLNRHLATHNTIPGNYRPRKHMCDVCEKFVYNLKQHKMIHMSKKNYTCDICGRQFALMQYLKMHLVTHDEDKSFYTCFTCNGRFDNKVKLKRHIMVHNGERNFKCNICQKAFYLNKHLKQHLVTHTGEKNFKCDVCEKTFSQGGHLLTHRLTHTSESKFTCITCNSNFRFKSSLTKHKKRYNHD